MDLKKISENLYDEFLVLHRELTVIPAPSGFEDERAEYILKYLHNAGFSNAYIDEAKNVIWTYGEPSEKMVLFMAHTDTVFPMDTPLNYVDDGEKIHCPGCGDDTCSLAMMMLVLKYMKENNLVPQKTLMFVANSCEEGLGNLKGCRQIFKDFGDKIEYMYSFDSKLGSVTNRSVGSHRYEITVETEGGHSFGAFGNRNALVVLSEIITEIYKIEVPKIDKSRTTYNVGIVEGGTSINTIAQSAKMLCEYRSDNVDCLEIMRKKFESIFEAAKDKCLNIEAKLVGERPCMSNDINMDEMEFITKRAVSIQSKHSGRDVKTGCGSTDCNIPHSLGIAALALANYDGKGTHTREEWIDKSTLKPGLAITLELILTEGGIL